MALSAGTLSHATLPYGWLLTAVRALTSLRYRPEGARDLRLDLLRGFCVFAMVVDHVGGASWLYGLTGGNRWVVSAGEGFVFLSGLVAGLVYSRKMARHGLAATTWALLRRARTLYLVTVAMTLGFVALASWTELTLWVDRSGGLGAESLSEIVVGTLALRYAYHGSDILAVYTLLLLASPMVFFLLREGYAGLVLAGSWLLWAGYNLFPDTFTIWSITNSHYFPLAAWQALFVTGLVVGHARAEVERRGPIRWSHAAKASAPWLALVVLLIALVAVLRAVNPLGILPPSSFRLSGLEHEAWATGVWDKVGLGPGRLLAFATLGTLAYVALTLLWQPVQRALGWLLIPLGAGALPAYACHLFIVVAGYNLALLGTTDPELVASNTIGQLGLVLLLWALVQAPGALKDTMAMMRSVTIRRRKLCRSLAGCLASALILLLAAHESALSAPSMASLPQIQAVPITAPMAPIAPGLQQAPSAAQFPPGLMDELAQLGYTVATDGPRALPLTAGQLIPRAFTSTSLGRRMPYYVYLPPGYDASTQRYPVVYLLHGYYGSFMEWAEIGIHQAADELILYGQIEPMIIVMPEGEQSYFVNHGSVGPRWADYIVTDVVRDVDRNFRTIPSTSARAIGGLSMGGTGALQLSMNHPGVFGVVGAHAPTLKWERPGDKFAFADDDYYQAVNPLVLAGQVDTLDDVMVWLDVGEDDWDWFTVDALHAMLEDRGVVHEFTYLAGGHAAEYWVDHQHTFLRFYDRAFRSRG